MKVPDSHLPTPEFRARLERKLVLALRRNRTMAPMTRSAVHWLKIAAVLMAAVGLGAVAGVASAQVQDARQSEQLLAAARADVDLAKMRVELARSHAATLKERYRLGLTGREVVASAEAEEHRMVSELATAELNLEEIRGSSAPPRNDIAAPLVKGRDFVTERIMLRLDAVQKSLAVSEAALAEAENRNRLGVASGLVVMESRAEVTQHRAELELLSDRMELRQEFLKNPVDAGTITRREQRLELTRAIRVAEVRQHLVQTRLGHVRERHRLGQADQVELLRADLAASEASLDLQRLRLQLSTLDEAGG